MGQVPYFGSQWWILPDTIIDEIYPVFDNKRFCNIISDTFSCDETFFQTAIMMNPQRAKNIMGTECEYRNHKWFAIFQNGHPVILRKKNYEQLVNSGALFGRKFDMSVDSEIMDMLDNRIL